MDKIEATITSLQNQIYTDWELLVACNEQVCNGIIPELNEIGLNEPRVKINLGPYENNIDGWNKLLASSSGELVGVMDEGDRLQSQALFEVIHKFNLTRELDLVYSDEDILRGGGKREKPFFKPGWSPDLLLSMNYIGRLWIARKELVKEAGGFLAEDQEDYEYGLLLRMTEKTKHITSIKTVLYSRWWENCSDDLLISNKAEKVITNSLIRRGIKGSVAAGPAPGTYRIKREIEGKPKVSLIIATNGNSQYLFSCLESILKNTTYTNYEMIIINNGVTFNSQIEELLKPSSFKVINRSMPFNRGQINNYAVKESSGDFLLFVHEDVKVITPNWIETLLENAQRKEVAVVGAKLLSFENKIQNAGLFLVNDGDGIRQVFKNLPAESKGYFNLAAVQRNCSAVSGACFLVRREVFNELGGFSGRFTIINDDYDFCLRALEKKYLIVWTPYVTLYQYEKEANDSLEENFDKQKFREIWKDVLERGDQYYNPNLSQDSDKFEINSTPLLIKYSPWPVLIKKEIKNILVVKLDHLGDVILAIPAIKRLKQMFPEANITALVGPWAKPILENEPSIQKIITYDGFSSENSSEPLKWLTDNKRRYLKKWLGEFNFDLAVDLRSHTETREFLALSGAKYTAGYAKINEFPWLTIALAYDEDKATMKPRRHNTQSLVELAEFVGADSSQDSQLNVTFSDELKNSVDGMMQQSGLSDRRSVIAIHPGVGSPIRRWPLEYFARLADNFCNRNDATVLIFTGKDEEKLVENIMANITRKESIFSMAGKVSLDGFLYALKKCDLFIGNNSGPIHMAASIGVPALGIYAGTSHVFEWGPVGLQAAAIYRNMPCSPCYFTSTDQCPYDMACLKKIYPEQVWQVAQRFLPSDRN
jgi:lipopolysaccharide heptosyltransferase II